MGRLGKIQNFIRENVFPIVALLMLFSFPFSEALLSISAVIIFALFFIPFEWKRKFNKLRLDKSLHALVGVFVIYLIGLFFCLDWKTGIYEIQKNIFWFLLPIGIATAKRLSSSQFWWLLMSFILFVTISSFITAFKIIYPDQFHIIDFRNASFVSHVSFSFQIILSFFIFANSFNSNSGIFIKIPPYIKVIWMIWLIFFLILQKSLLGILSLYVASIYFIGVNLNLLESKLIKQLARTIVIIIIISPFLYVGSVYFDFHKELDNKPLTVPVYTQLGNQYSFKFDDLEKENGHYVNWYINADELKDAWDARSVIKLDECGSTGYKIYYTLIRYMTSKGLKKDAEGVSKLSEKDILNVQNGVANYIYAEKKYSLYPRIYETIWEFEHYRNTGNPNNQSLSQRFEYVRGALYLMKTYPLGIGTGNFKLKFKEAYERINSNLNKDLRFHVHNQYLSYTVKFGVLGMILIFSLVFYAINRKRQFKNKLLMVLLIVIMVSNFGEAILETHTGLSFFVFFLSLFLWHSPDELRH